jgi:hypothetical protein
MDEISAGVQYTVDPSGTQMCTESGVSARLPAATKTATSEVILAIESSSTRGTEPPSTDEGTNKWMGIRLSVAFARDADAATGVGRRKKRERRMRRAWLYETMLNSVVTFSWCS